ncbi:MAG: phage portal protein, partial [Halanaerobiales bacterium]|nr:phage portal protein [Halanaerobiales bacterium]
MYKKHPIVHGAVDKFVDFVVGPGINVTSENEKAEIIIEQWIQDIDFNFILRKWIKDALMKGTGFVELGIIDKTVAGLKVLNANWMYIKRDEKGKLEGYNQYKSWDFGIEFKKSKIQFFKPGEVIHLSISAVGDEEYGCGVVNPQLNAINSLLANEKSFQMLMNRKANAPYWDKQGWINPTNPGASILPSDSSLSTTEEKLTMLKDKT